MTKQELDKIKESLSKISPWPWQFEQLQTEDFFLNDVNGEPVDHLWDRFVCGFIASAPQTISDLLDEIEKLKQGLEIAKQVLKAISFDEEPVEFDLPNSLFRQMAVESSQEALTQINQVLGGEE